MLLPGQTKSSTRKFHVQTTEGLHWQSEGYGSIEGARNELAMEWWRGRKPSIVRIETTETLVEQIED